MENASSPISTTVANAVDIPIGSLLRNISQARRFAIDIGNSLAKLAYSSRLAPKRTSSNKDDKAINAASEHDVHLHLIKFEAAHVEQYLSFIRERLNDSQTQVHPIITATGCGAHKYKKLIEEKLNLTVHKEDEISCLIRGCNFLLQNITDEAFSYHHHEQTKFSFEPGKFQYPYMLVNIGSGVSVIKVNGDDDYERVGGTSFGGGSFWGLGSLLTGAKGFEELMSLAHTGDHRNIDMLVSDIYGPMDSYESLKLPGDIIASSFGKTVRSQYKHDYDASDFQSADMARSLLLTVSNTIGQMAVLYAMLHKINRIYFGGFFIRGNPITMRTITYAVNYFSKGETSALFLRHEGYLGAIGAFAACAERTSVANDSLTSKTNNHTDTTFDSRLILQGAPDQKNQTMRRHAAEVARQISWREHYAGSMPSAFARQYNPSIEDAFPRRIPASQIPSDVNRAMGEVDVFELEIARTNLVDCCLLKNGYMADTVDLTQDEAARIYWIECLRKGLNKTVSRAASSEADGAERARQFEQCYEHHLELLLAHPFAYGRLNVRSLLDLNVQLLNEFGFVDIFKDQKRFENNVALKELPHLLAKIDAITDQSERHRMLAQGLLAGNVFDWGAGKVADMMLDGTLSTFEEARKELQPRPWLCDDLDAWTQRMTCGRPYRRVCVFVDNSGHDIICGVLPFIRELLKQGTEIIMCANVNPVINDITCEELTYVMNDVRKLDRLFDASLESGQLKLADSGQTSPCLDLSRIDVQLNEMMLGCDLILIEGMGRALHTNFYAKFTCDSLKVAVVKNDWLAKRLGGQLFAVIFKFEQILLQEK